jgi:hypothetical protein
MSSITPARVFGSSRQQSSSYRSSTAEEHNSLARSVNNSDENSLFPWTLSQTVRFLQPLDGPSCTVEPILSPLPRPPRPPLLPLGRHLILLLCNCGVLDSSAALPACTENPQSVPSVSCPTGCASSSPSSATLYWSNVIKGLG